MDTVEKGALRPKLVCGLLVLALGIPAPAAAGNKALRDFFLFTATANAINQVFGDRYRAPRQRVIVADPGLEPAEVAEIQAGLNQAGYRAGAVDGQWGIRTRNAVVAWQKEHQFAGTGTLDDVQTAMLLGYAPGVMSSSGTDVAQQIGPGSLYASLVSPGPDALRGMQSDLKFLGYFQGRPDGVWGADSQRALDRFRLENPEMLRPLNAMPDGHDMEVIAAMARDREDEITRQLELQLDLAEG